MVKSFLSCTVLALSISLSGCSSMSEKTTADMADYQQDQRVNHSITRILNKRFDKYDIASIEIVGTEDSKHTPRYSKVTTTYNTGAKETFLIDNKGLYGLSPSDIKIIKRGDSLSLLAKGSAEDNIYLSEDYRINSIWKAIQVTQDIAQKKRNTNSYVAK